MSTVLINENLICCLQASKLATLVMLLPCIQGVKGLNP